MAAVYVLFSSHLERFYIGSCKDFGQRFNDHSNHIVPTSFTAKAKDWEIYLVVNDLSYRQAREMELHLKRMKSSKYILNLKKYPEIVEKLKQKYAY